MSKIIYKVENLATKERQIIVRFNDRRADVWTKIQTYNGNLKCTKNLNEKFLQHRRDRLRNYFAYLSTTVAEKCRGVLSIRDVSFDEIVYKIKNFVTTGQ